MNPLNQSKYVTLFGTVTNDTTNMFFFSADTWLGMLEFLYIVIGIVFLVGLHRDAEEFAQKMFFMLRVGVLIVWIAFIFSPHLIKVPSAMEYIIFLISICISFYAFFELLFKLFRGSWKTLDFIPVINDIKKRPWFTPGIWTVICGFILMKWIGWAFFGGVLDFDTVIFGLISLILIPLCGYFYLHLVIAFVGGVKDDLQMQINKFPGKDSQKTPPHAKQHSENSR